MREWRVCGMAQTVRLICLGIIAFLLLCVAVAAFGQQIAPRIVGVHPPDSAEWYQVRLADLAIILGLVFQSGYGYRMIRDHDKWLAETDVKIGRVHGRLDEHIRDHASGRFALVRRRGGMELEPAPLDGEEWSQQ